MITGMAVDEANDFLWFGTPSSTFSAIKIRGRREEEAKSNPMMQSWSLLDSSTIDENQRKAMEKAKRDPDIVVPGKFTYSITSPLLQATHG